MFILQLLENRTLSLDDSQIFFAKWLTPFCNRHIQEALDKKEEELQKLKTRKYRSLDDDFEFITEFVVLPEIKEHIESQSFHEITEEHQKFCDGLSDEPSLKQEVRWYRLVGKHEKVECFITKEIPSTTVRPKQVPRPKRVDQLQEWYLKYKLSKIHDMREWNRSIEDLGHRLDATEDANLKENLEQRIDNNERDRDSVCQLINDATIIMVNLQARGALFKLWSELDSFRSITPECCGSLGRLLSNARSLVKFDNKRLRQVMSILQQLENGTLSLDDNQISFDREFKLFYNRHIQEALNKKKEELQKLKTRKYRSYDDDFEFMTEFVDDFDSSNCVAPKIGVEVLSDVKKAKSKNNDKSEDKVKSRYGEIEKYIKPQSCDKFKNSAVACHSFNDGNVAAAIRRRLNITSEKFNHGIPVSDEKDTINHNNSTLHTLDKRFPIQSHQSSGEGLIGGECGWASLNFVADHLNLDRIDFNDLQELQQAFYEEHQKIEPDSHEQKPSLDGCFSLTVLGVASEQKLNREIRQYVDPSSMDNPTIAAAFILNKAGERMSHYKVALVSKDRIIVRDILKGATDRQLSFDDFNRNFKHPEYCFHMILRKTLQDNNNDNDCTMAPSNEGILLLTNSKEKSSDGY